jgi:hypothetical protein
MPQLPGNATAVTRALDTALYAEHARNEGGRFIDVLQSFIDCIDKSRNSQIVTRHWALCWNC